MVSEPLRLKVKSIFFFFSFLLSMAISNPDYPVVSATNQLIQFNPASQLPIKLSGSSKFSKESSVWNVTSWPWSIRSSWWHHTSPNTNHFKGRKTIPNPAYRLWFRQDKLIQNALLASVDPKLASIIASTPSSQIAWASLHAAFTNKSQTRIFRLHDRLNKVSKETKTISEYLQEIRSIVDELTTAGSHASIAELIVKILSGLGLDYHGRCHSCVWNFYLVWRVVWKAIWSGINIKIWG